MKEVKLKLNQLLVHGFVEERLFFSNPHDLNRDEKDIYNDELSFSFCEIDYLVNPKVADALNLIFNFFVDWRVCFDHKKFIENLSEKSKLLPTGKTFEDDFYKNEWENQFNKSIELMPFIGKTKDLNFLATNAVDLIYDFVYEFLFHFITPKDLKNSNKSENLNDLYQQLVHNFLKTFPSVRPVLRFSDSVKIHNFLIDQFYDNYPAFYLIENYFKTESLQKIYDAEVIKENIEYLKSYIYNSRNLVVQVNDELLIESDESITFEDIFHKREDAARCLRILQEMEPAVINETCHYIGKNKGIFPMFIKELQNTKPEPLIKFYPDKIYKDVLNAKIKGLHLSKDASEFRKKYRRIKDMNLHIKALLSQSSQKGK